MSGPIKYEEGAVFVKDPDAVLDFGWDWSDWLNPGDQITSSTWLVSSPELIPSDETFSADKTLLVLSGGVLFQSYDVTNRITTTPGNLTEDRTMRIDIQNR